MIKSLKEFVIVGGGAAGIFAALAAKSVSSHISVVLLEKSAVLLSKVKISGGGRCNVTHACFDPSVLVHNYPRGQKELVGPFHRFQPKDTIEWFENRGVALKTEEDGRVFPCTNSSQTIIDCLMTEAKALDIDMRMKQKIESIEYREGVFEIKLGSGELLTCPKLLLATGSSLDGYGWAKQFGHTIQSPVPSLFTFNIPSSPLHALSGISWNPVKVTLPKALLSQTGPLLITHFGLSGPAVLKLSAWGARFLYDCQYETSLILNWLPDLSEDAIFQKLQKCKKDHPRQNMLTGNPFRFPKNLWNTLLEGKGEKSWITFSDKILHRIAQRLHEDHFSISGKTTHKEEFVTCGGVTLSEVDFKTMQSKICPGLYFAGEVLDIDGVTGGFNFQNAWTTGYLAGCS